MLTVPRAVREEVVAHAREGAPEEVCGVLGGAREESDARVAVALPAANVAERPRRTYRMDPGEQLAAVEAVEAEGHAVLGFYHSHPAGPLAPSQRDVAGARWPDHRYVIVALDGDPAVGSWLWSGESFEREAVVVA